MNEQMKMTYKAHPLSFVMKLLVWICAAATVGVFLMLVGYVLVRGVP